MYHSAFYCHVQLMRKNLKTKSGLKFVRKNPAMMYNHKALILKSGLEGVMVCFQKDGRPWNDYEV